MSDLFLEGVTYISLGVTSMSLGVAHVSVGAIAMPRGCKSFYFKSGTGLSLADAPFLLSVQIIETSILID